MKLHEIPAPPGSRKPRKRVGRGEGSGYGKTAGKGHKGQKARSGGKTQRGFEGGQMPLARRLPKRGFKNPFRVAYQAVNLSDLKRFESGAAVTPEMLHAAGLAGKKGEPIKILGKGDVDRALKVTANAFSKTAADKIRAAGGTVTEIGLV
jgi:large subunit ribosomal protein L15